jgi:FAD/FMN-containing dehydrogenase
MNKVATYLQSHISGEVLASEAIRERFATDASILTIKPSLVVYPRTTNDIRKAARFSWQLAERGHVLPITARGNGTDLTGAAIGKGIILSFPAHLNKILELDTKQKLARVQPGVNFKSLQETLHTHGFFLPPAPESYEYSTVGGAIANNASGIRSDKYGDMRAWVDRLEVVLANGEVIQTGPLSKKELNKKLGLPTLEGELYRAVDAILSDNADTITAYEKAIHVATDNVGYALETVRSKNGTVDLTPLFVGSQGTLGLITEIILRVESYLPTSALTVAAFANLDDALEVAEKLRALKPSALELVDAEILKFAQKHNNIELPEQLMVGEKTPGTLLFIEASNIPERALGKFTKHVTKLISGYTDHFLNASDLEEREKLWSYRYVTAAFMSYDVGGKAATPIVQSIAVPPAALHQFIQEAKALSQKYHVETALWAHALSGSVMLVPLLDLSKLGDRQRVFKLMEEYFGLTIKLGGSIAAQSGEGRLRAPFAALQTGSDLAVLYQQLKTAADPNNTLNPGVKLGTEPKELVDLLRKDYSLAAFADYLPRM